MFFNENRVYNGGDDHVETEQCAPFPNARALIAFAFGTSQLKGANRQTIFIRVPTRNNQSECLEHSIQNEKHLAIRL